MVGIDDLVNVMAIQFVNLTAQNLPIIYPTLPITIGIMPNSQEVFKDI